MDPSHVGEGGSKSTCRTFVRCPGETRDHAVVRGEDTQSPQAGILGVGRVYDGLRWEGDTAVKAAMMRLSLTWDHRVLDGAPAAEFLAAVRDFLESPYRLLV